MLLCPTERARTPADAEELKALYAKFAADGCSAAPILDTLLSQAVQANSVTGFYYQIDPDVCRGSKRSLVSAAATTASSDGSWCHLHYVVSPLARRVSFVADVLTQLERGNAFTLCTASVRPSYLTSMKELGGSLVEPPSLVSPIFSMTKCNTSPPRFSAPQLLPP